MNPQDFRSIVDRLEQINEARGIGARTPGESFINISTNEVWTLDTIEFYPESGKEITSDELGKVYTKVANRLLKEKISVDSVKPAVNINTKAFGVVVLVNPKNQEKIAFIHTFKEVKPSPENYTWNNQTGLDGFRLGSKAAEKGTIKIQASDILTNLDNLTSKDIAKQISTYFGADHSLSHIAQYVAGNNSLPYTFIAPTDIPFAAFRDYFCEILQPMALINGTGQWDWASESTELNDGNFTSYSINFNGSKTGGLSDSILINKRNESPHEVKLSSKGAAGAPAASSNLLKAAKELSIANPKMAADHKDIIDLLQRMVDAGQWEAPLILGIEYKIISEDEANLIRDTRKLPPVSKTKIEKYLTPNLAKLANATMSASSNKKADIILFPLLICTIAKKVGTVINEDPHRKFSKAACDILNYSFLMQMYTTVRDNGRTWILEKFKVKYPSTETTNVWFDAGKTYWATGCNGNFTFIIEKNGKSSKPVDDQQSSSKKQTANVDGQSQDQIKDIANRKSVTNLRPNGSKVVSKKSAGERNLKETRELSPMRKTR
jgi:hypothetical protein